MTETLHAPHIRIGVGGWVYEGWRKNFYPDDLPKTRELEHMVSKVTAIEINGTYYGSQKPETYAKWREAAPEGFQYALKGPRFATNRKKLKEAEGSIAKFFESGVAGLGEALGPINWQFMATKQFDAEDFADFLALLPRSHDGVDLRHVVEVRHESFVHPEFVTLLREHEVAVAIAGDSEFPLIADVTAPFVYLRLMGTDAAHVKGYGDADAMDWVDRMRVFAAGGAPQDLPAVTEPSPAQKASRDVYAFVIAGAKARNPFAATAMIAMLSD